MSIATALVAGLPALPSLPLGLPSLPGLPARLPPMWPSQLRAASFRGVPFYVADHSYESGRRLAVTEFPFRDDTDVEDLGRARRIFTVNAYLVDDDYFPSARFLQSACEDNAVTGLLIHPWMGDHHVRCQRMRRLESQKEGRFVRFEITFISIGAVARPSPLALLDTVSAVIARAGDVLGALQNAFALIHSVSSLPSFVAACSLGMVQELGADLLGFVGLPGLAPGSVLGFADGLINAGAELIAAPLDLAGAIAGAFAGIADLVMTVLDAGGPMAQAPDPWAPSDLDASLSGCVSRSANVLQSRTVRIGPADPGWGMAPFAAWRPRRPEPAGSTLSQVAMGTNIAAIADLARGAAVVALAQIYAATDWPDQPAAASARDGIADMVDERALAADAAGQPRLTGAWAALAVAVSRDMTARAMQAPEIATYSQPLPPNSLWLAHRLYQDASRADQLVGLGAAIHPAFMPATGPALAT